MRVATVYQNVVTQKWYLVVGTEYGLQPIDNRLSPTAGIVGDHVFTIAPATGKNADDVTVFEFQTESEAFLAQAIHYANALDSFEEWYKSFSAKSEDAAKVAAGYATFKETVTKGLSARSTDEKAGVIAVEYPRTEVKEDG